MANTEQQQGTAGAAPGSEQVAAGLSAKGASRRRFARAGAGASGVILTLTSQPGMASLVCASPSGSLSGTYASHHNISERCNGVSPGYWKTHHEEWPGGTTFGNSLFKSTFPCTSSTAKLKVYSCFDVVDPDKVTNGDDPNNVAMHIMATLLNVRTARITFLTELQVKAIWHAYAATGTYTPSAGVTWNGAQIVTYLTSTMG
ncbi:MAG TPA: hypothetical protein VFG03_14840 [Telluria sp.]|nr:hypothetical protein [Telluria sp.]